MGRYGLRANQWDWIRPVVGEEGFARSGGSG